MSTGGNVSCAPYARCPLCLEKIEAAHRARSAPRWRRGHSRATRVTSVAIIVALLVPFLDMPKAWAAYQAREQQRTATVEMAKRMNIDPQLLLDPAAYQEKKAREAREWRDIQVHWMEQRNQQDPAKIEAARRQVAEIEEAYALTQVSALADDVADLESAMADHAKGDPTASARIVALDRASLRHQDSVLRTYDSSVNRRLARLPAKFQRRHRDFMATARGDLGAIDKGLRHATRDPKRVDAGSLRSMQPRLDRVGARREGQRWIVDAPAERVVVEAQRGAWDAAAVREAQKDFRPGPVEVVRGVVTGLRKGPVGPRARGIAPLLMSALAPFLSGVAGLPPQPPLPPVPADTEPNVDAPSTHAEIVELAATLGHDPVRIYNFVHDTIETQIYPGSRKGALGCLRERAGNDADQASLLIALLRASGIPARYEHLGVRLPPDEWKSLTGLNEEVEAAAMLATAYGSGAVRIVDVIPAGGSKATSIPHIDVFLVSARAHVPFGSYRGVAPAGAAADAWVRLFPVLKRYRTQAAVDLRPGAAFDFNAYLRTVSSKSPLEAWEDQLRAYIQAEGIECTTLDAATPRRTIIPDELPYLRGEAQVEVLEQSTLITTLPVYMQEPIEWNLGHRGSIILSKGMPLAAAYGKRISLTYAPATQDDADVIASFGGLENTPLYLVHLKAQLHADAELLAEGPPQAAGTENDFVVEMGYGNSRNILRHVSVAGSLHVWGFDPGTVPAAALDAAETALASAPADSDAAALARLHLMSLRYFQAYDVARDRITGIHQSRYIHDTSEGMFSYPLTISNVGGAGLQGQRDTILFDVGRTLTTPFAIAGRTGASRAIQKLLLGQQGSALEHLTAARFHGPHQYSAVSFLNAAYASGITVYQFDADDVESYIPLLQVDPSLKQAVRDAAKPGRTMTVPAAEITPPTFRPLFGFIAADHRTGGAQYLIGGVSDGNEGSAEDGGGDGSGGPDGCTACSGPTNSTVILSRGNYTFDETDLNLAARAIPISFSRAYHSFYELGGGRLGPGWIHNWAVQLRPSADGLTMANLDGERFFAANGDGTYQRAHEIRAQLRTVDSGYDLEFFDGRVWSFDPEGRLVSQADLNDNKITLQYSEGRLTTVTDASGRVALTFDYDSTGSLLAVTDAATRTIAFGYDLRGRLTSVTSVLGDVRSFAYDQADRLIAKTDYSGNAYQIAYDEHGRWVRSTDPLGNAHRASYDFARGQATLFDRRGVPTTYEFGSQGQKTALVDALGNRTRYTYDAMLNLASVIDARGATTAYEHDVQGNKIEEVSPDGTVTQYLYGPYARLTDNVQDANGYAILTSNTYDAHGNLIAATDALNNTTSYEYTSDGLPSTISHPGASVMKIGYDANGNIASMIDPTNGETLLEYDGAGNLISMTDASGQPTTFELNAKGQILAQVGATGARTEFTYDDDGRQLTIRDPASKTSSTTYDALGRPTASTNAIGEATRMTYDAEGNVLSVTDHEGRATRFEYDALGRQVSMTDPAGVTTRSSFCANDADGQVCESSDAFGNVSRTDYDSQGRPSVVTDSLGYTTEMTYDALGRKLFDTDQLGKTSAYVYDDAGRLVATVDPLEGQTSFAYDVRGNRTSSTDANNHSTHYTYDASNRLLTETTPLGASRTFTYDVAGNRRTQLDPNGNTTTFQYDESRRLTRKDFADGTYHEWRYDVRGLKIFEYSPAITRTFEYDDLGRTTAAVDHRWAEPKALRYAYDARGNRASMTVTPENMPTRYSYDERGFLRTLTDPDGDTWHFTYDVLGRRTELRHPNGVTGFYTYTKRSEVESIVWRRQTGQVLSAAIYTYDARGNRTSRAYEDGGVESYEYDELSRLIGVTYPDGARRVEYDYDAVGNRLAMRESTLDEQSQPIAGCNRVTDADCDGIHVDADNCPTIYNPDQENSDGGAFYEDFGSPSTLANWEQTKHPPTGGSQTAQIAAGNLSLNTSSSGTASHGAYFLRKNYADSGSLRFSVQGDMRGGGVAFRYQDAQHMYRFRRYSAGGGSAFDRIERISGDVVTMLAEMPTSQQGVDFVSWHVEADGPSLRVLKGETVLLQAQDATYATGRAGLFGWSGSAMTFASVAAGPLDGRGDACDPCPGNPDPSCAPACDDSDGDGYGSTAGSCGKPERDCATGDEDVHPGAADICNGVDDDCDGQVDDTCQVTVTNYDYNQFNQLQASVGVDGTTTYRYDLNGNRLSKETAVGEHAYSFDLAGRLFSITKPDGSVTETAYGPNGSRVAITTEDEDTEIIADGVHEMLHVSPEGEIAAAYLWDPSRIDSILKARETDVGLFGMVDDQASAEAWSDSKGMLRSQRRYDAYGAANDDGLVRVGNAGRWAVAGDLYFNRARHYDPASGTFMSADAFGMDDSMGSLRHLLAEEDGNSYRYAGDNPISASDPTGFYCHRKQMGPNTFGLSPNLNEDLVTVSKDAPGHCMYFGLRLVNEYFDMTGHQGNDYEAPPGATGIWGPHVNIKSHSWGRFGGGKFGFKDYSKNYHSGVFFKHSGGVCDRTEVVQNGTVTYLRENCRYPPGSGPGFVPQAFWIFLLAITLVAAVVLTLTTGGAAAPAAAATIAAVTFAIRQNACKRG